MYILVLICVSFRFVSCRFVPFRAARYAYHLRRWALEGQAISSHVTSWELGAVPLHVVVHAAGMTDKVTLELSSTDYVADLRAEVSKWWEAIALKRPQTNVSLDSTRYIREKRVGNIRMYILGYLLRT